MTLGDDLVRQRLEHRRGRLEQVVRALQDRERIGVQTRELRRAVEGFQAELDEVRAQLRRGPDVPAMRSSRAHDRPMPR